MARMGQAGETPACHEDHDRAEIDDTRLRGLVGYQLRRAGMAMQQRFSLAIGEPFGLRQVEFFALSLLAENTALTHKQISAALAIAPSNMVSIMAGLEQRGLVGRCANRADGRSFFWGLTGSGEEIIHHAQAAVATMEQTALAAAEPVGHELIRALDGLWSSESFR